MSHSLLILWCASLCSCLLFGNLLSNKLLNTTVRNNRRRGLFKYRMMISPLLRMIMSSLMIRMFEERNKFAICRLLRMLWRGLSLPEIGSDGKRGHGNGISRASYLVDDILSSGIWLLLWGSTCCLFAICAICNPFLNVFLAGDLVAFCSQIFWRILLLKRVGLFSRLALSPALICLRDRLNGFLRLFRRAKIFLCNWLLNPILGLI